MSKRNPVYTIQITAEQIKMVRSLVLRADQLYLRNRLAESVEEGGDIKTDLLVTCYFCNKGAYDQAAFIPHTDKCIMPWIEKEYNGLNEQFMKVESEVGE